MKRYKHKCLRCDYEWFSSKQNPATCANTKCRSPYWNRERMVNKRGAINKPKFVRSKRTRKAVAIFENDPAPKIRNLAVGDTALRSSSSGSTKAPGRIARNNNPADFKFTPSIRAAIPWDISCVKRTTARPKIMKGSDSLEIVIPGRRGKTGLA